MVGEMREEMEGHQHPRPPNGMEELCIDPIKGKADHWYSPCPACSSQANCVGMMGNTCRYHCPNCDYDFQEEHPRASPWRLG